MMSDETPESNAGDDQDVLAALARDLASETDLEAVWDRISVAAVANVDGAEHAGTMVVRGKSVSTSGASDDIVNEIDELQYASGEGPCLTAALDGQHVVLVDDLRSDARWPVFAQAASDLGVRSMLSFLLYTDREDFGALNIYSHEASAFDDAAVHAGSVLAAHAAAAAAAATRSENFTIALGSRDRIGQAKGILMERYKLTEDQAFDLLVAASQRTNRKLNDVAEQLASTGELAVPPGP